ncbi:hypothetical protein [Actinomadura rugatobispora]|uniref:Secreted protein n=1 Tax=Actinomadura rugatobispora TaxID=1994 RepID=A0ABW1A395_9ACTN|nr:hypothetical protein GCM10010200_019230 [Actinomadura rugatobispora]
MTRFGKLARCAATAVVAVGAVSLAAGPANADSKTCKKFYVGGGWGCYQSYGDIIRVKDTSWDGWGVRVKWHTADGRSGNCVDGNGSNNGTVTCNKDFAEKLSNGEKNLITYRVQEIEDGDIGDESGWQGVET